MANYWEYHRNKELRDKVKHEMQLAAIAVMAEDAVTASHAERVIYAKLILDGSASAEEYAIGVITNPTVNAHIIAGTDYTSDLAFVVQSMFNAFAGVSL